MARNPAANRPTAEAPPAADLAVQYRPLRDLTPYARNSRKHPRKQIAQIKASLVEFGWTNPMLIADGVMIAGHGRLVAALELAEAGVAIPRNADAWAGPTIDLSHLSEAQRRAYVIADNRIAEGAEWDDDLLGIELGALKAEGFSLALTGFGTKEIEDLLGGGGEPGDEPRGSLLELVNVTIAEPTITAAKGDHFRLSNRHHLFCCGVIEDWPTWAAVLQPGALFVPYPGPFVPHGAKAAERMLVMVQPDPYIAGHLLDRYAEVHGADAIAKIASAPIE